MSLTWHIVKKDLRALKWPLLVWVLLIVARLGVGVTLLNADGTEGIEWFMKMDVLARLLGGFEFISFVLAAALIQQDLMVGTTSFWMTRPIAGARLLRAKLWALGLLFGLLPLLLTMPWWLYCGYGPGEIGWAIAETVAVHAIAVLVALMWSAVTDGLARFLMWTVVTLFTVPALTGTILYGLKRLLHTSPDSGVMATRVILGGGLAVAGILVVVIHQYLTRNTRRSITLLAASAGLIVLIGVAWPWNLNIDGGIKEFLDRRAVGEWPTATAPAGLKFSILAAEVSGPGRRNGSVGALNLKYNVDGLAGSQLLMAHGGECMLRWPDGNVEPAHARVRRDWVEHSGSRTYRGTLQALRPKPDALPFSGEDPSEEAVTTTVGLNPWVAERFKTEAPACTLMARLRLMQFESAIPIPLPSGGSHAAGNRDERIVHAEKSGEELQVVFIRVVPSLGIDNVGRGPLAPEGPFIQYYLVNKARDFADRGRSAETRLTRIGTVGISWQTVVYRASSRAGGLRPVLEAINALNDAELIKVTYLEQARFTQVIQADPLNAVQTSR